MQPVFHRLVGRSPARRGRGEDAAREFEADLNGFPFGRAMKAAEEFTQQ